jgi:hypothetical protein
VIEPTDDTRPPELFDCLDMFRDDPDENDFEVPAHPNATGEPAPIPPVDYSRIGGRW